MGAECSTSVDALSHLDGKVDGLANELHTILREHRNHSGVLSKVAVSSCLLCADVLASYSMRVYDLQMNIDKLANGDPSSEYRLTHAHRPPHERQELSFHARSVLSQIESILNDEIYHLEQPHHDGPPSAPVQEDLRQAGGHHAAPRPYDDKVQQELSSGVGKTDTTAEDRYVPIITDAPGGESAPTRITARASASANDNTNRHTPKPSIDSRSAGMSQPAFDVIHEGPDDEAETADDDEAENIDEESRADAPIDAKELDSRLAKLSTEPDDSSRKIRSHRTRAPSHKHNVSLQIQTPLLADSERGRSREPRKSSNATSGSSWSTRATYGDDSEPDLDATRTVDEQDDVAPMSHPSDELMNAQNETPSESASPNRVVEQSSQLRSHHHHNKHMRSQSLDEGQGTVKRSIVHTKREPRSAREPTFPQKQSEAHITMVH